MNCLTILLIYVLMIRNGKEICKVENVCLLKNDFWCVEQEQLNTDKGYLYKVDINLESENGVSEGFYCFSGCFYPLNSTIFGYIVLEDSMTEYITSFLKSPEECKFLLRFFFLFIDKLNSDLNRIQNYEGRIQEHVTYKRPEKLSENVINLKCDISTDTRIKYIKRMFGGLISLKIVNYNEFINNVNEKRMELGILKKIEDEAEFNLYYFENHQECLKNLNEFIEELRYFKLMKDNNVNDSSTDETTTLKVSELEERLRKKCFEKLENLYNNENWKLLLDECFIYLKNKMLKKQIYLLIGGKYNIDYYIEEFNNIVYESVVENQEKFSISNPKDKELIINVIIGSLKLGLKKLQFLAIQDLFEFEYISKHFFKLLGRKVETSDDYIQVEKLMCDYYNMFVYILNVHQKLYKKSNSLYSYSPPISTDSYNLMIIDGIKITFNYPNKFRKIRGYDEKGERIVMVENTDYVIGEFGFLYCSLEVLKIKNIQEIELVSFNNVKYDTNNKKFKINEFY